MRKFNFTRPLLILAVAYLANTLTKTICHMLGVAEESASNIALAAMLIAAILTFIKLNKPRNKQ